MVDVATLAADIEAKIEEFRQIIRSQIFDAALPLLGDDFADRADEALAFLDSVALEISNTLGALALSNPEATNQEIADALDAIIGIEASLDFETEDIFFNIDTSELSSEVNGAIAVALDAIGLDLDLGLSGGAFNLTGSVEGLGVSITGHIGFAIDGATGAVVRADDNVTDFSMLLTGALDLDASANLGFIGVDVIDNRLAPEINFRFDLDVDGAGDITASVDLDAIIDVTVETNLPADILPNISSGVLLGLSLDGIDLTSGGPLVSDFSLELYDVAIDMGGLADFFDGVFGQIHDMAGSFPLGKIVEILNTPLPLLGAIAPGDFGPEGPLVRDLVEALSNDVQYFEFLDAVLQVIDILETIESLRADGGRLELGGAILNGSGDMDTTMLDDFVPDEIRAIEDLLADLGDFGTAIGDALDGDYGDTPTEFNLALPFLDNPLELVTSVLFNGLGTDPVSLVEFDLPPLGFGFDFAIPIRYGVLEINIIFDLSGQTDFLIGYDTAGLYSDDGFDFAEGFYIGSDPDEGFASLTLGVGLQGGISVVLVEAGVEGGIRGTIGVNLVTSEPIGDDGLIRTRLADLASFPCIFDNIFGDISAYAGIYYSVGWGPLKISDRIDIAEVVLAQFNIDPCLATSSPGTDTPILSDTGLATQGDGDNGVSPNALVLNVGPEAANRTLPDGVGSDENGNPVVSESYFISAVRDADGNVVTGQVVVEGFGVGEIYGDKLPINRITGDGGQDRDSLVLEAGLEIEAELSGGAGGDLLSGGARGDTLYGDGGGDVLVGNGGIDALFGGEGEDLLNGGEGADFLNGGSDFDTVDYTHATEAVELEVQVLQPGVTQLLGHGGEAEGDVLSSIEGIIGSRFDDILRGNTYVSNVLQGGDGDDTLIGGEFTEGDLLEGGAGADDLRGGETDSVDDQNDRVTYARSSSAVYIDLITGLTYGGEATGDTFFSIEHFQLTSYADVFVGDDNNNEIDGREGDDILDGGLGEDVITAGSGNDIVYAYGDGDRLDGGGIEFTGSYAAMDDIGQDTLSYENANGAVSVDLSTGNGQLLGGSTKDKIDFQYTYEETVQQLVAQDGVSSFETLIGSVYADSLTGDNRANRIEGLSGADTINAKGGNDIIIGGAGADDMDGGAGSDWVDYSGAGGGVTVDLTGTGTGSDAQGDTYDRIENILGSSFVDNLTGDNARNIIDPGELTSNGVESIDGRGGVDTLRFTYEGVDSVLAVIDLPTESGIVSGAGQIEINSIEQLHLATGFAQDIIISTYEDQADIVTTGEGDDRISLGGGADHVLAGDGNDFVLRDVYTLQLRDRTGDFGGKPVAETFLIDGGDGIDALGIDLSFESEDLEIIAETSTYSSTLESWFLPSGGYIANFERLGAIATGSGGDSISLLGDDNNIIYTNAGADVVRPGHGFDYADGGESQSQGGGEHQDVLLLDYSSFVNAHVVVTWDEELSGPVEVQNPQALSYYPDFETVEPTIVEADYHGRASVYSDVLPDDIALLSQIDYRNFETLQIIGTDGDDYIEGVGDAFNFNVGDDRIDGGAGNDELYGGYGDDVLIGGLDADKLFGGFGDDVLDAGVVGHEDGLDELTGSFGADRYILGSEAGRYYADGNPNIANDRALITDFNNANDVIVLAGKPDEYTFSYNAATGIGSIRHIEEVDNGNGGTAFLITTVADLEGISTFDFNASYVEYVEIDPDAAQAALQTSDFAIASASARFATDLDNAAINPTSFDAIQQMIADGLNELMGDKAPKSGDITVEYEGAPVAIGEFNNAFDLATGIVISTGDVRDILGENTVDGSEADVAMGEYSAELVFEEVGTINGTKIFRAEIPNVPGGLNSLTISDGNNREGADGVYSGFDLDGVFISTTRLDSVSTPTDLSDIALDVFEFGPRSMFFTPGEIRGDSNQPLANTFGFLIDQAAANLGEIDADNTTFQGAFSMGDGGSVAFNLTETVDTTTPHYIYVGEASSNGETPSGSIVVSSNQVNSESDLDSDLGLPGEAGDAASITATFNVDAGQLFQGQPQYGPLFQIVLVTEELPENAGDILADMVKIRINGMDAAVLSDGQQLTMDNLAPSPFLPGMHEDVALNLVGEGALATAMKGDAYTTIITVSGPIIAGENTIEFEVADRGDGALDTALFIAPLGNQAPVAVDDDAQTTPSTSIEFNLLDNDYDPDGDPLTVTILNTPENGSINLADDGSGNVLYTPFAGFTGTDYFTYQITDPSGAIDTASVAVTMSPSTNNAPIAEDDFATTTDGDAVSIEVLANDSDADGDELTAVLNSLPENGQVNDTGDGRLVYTPDAGFVGEDSFTYNAVDSNGAKTQATVYISVEGDANAAPVTVDDAATTSEGVAVTGNVLANDSDPDGDVLEARLRSEPAEGVATIQSNGAFEYTPNEGFTGTDTFTYSAIDPSGERTTGTVTITVQPANTNEPPVAVEDEYETGVDEVVTGNVLENDFDFDEDPLTAELVKPPTVGTLILNSDGSFEYTPEEGFIGEVPFEYAAVDPFGARDVEEVIIYVEGDQAPVAVEDSFLTSPDTTLTGNVLTNDFDPEGEALTAFVDTGPTHGELVMDEDGLGGFTYTPNPGYIGPDSFIYGVFDPSGGEAYAVVTIEVGDGVNEAPVANDDVLFTDSNTPVDASVLANDFDPDNDALIANLLTPPLEGFVRFDSRGEMTYTPRNNFTGTDSFTYEAVDPSGESSTATVTINVGVGGNQRPDAVDDIAVTTEGVVVTHNVLANDTDPDGDVLAAALDTAPSNGQVLLKSNGDFNYTPDTGFVGVDSFTYVAADPSGASDIATVTVTVEGPNAPPVAVDDELTTPQDTPFTFNVLDNDSDPDGDTITAHLQTEPANGSVQLQSNGEVVYTPNAGFTGIDSFTYATLDVDGLSDRATVEITVEAPPTSDVFNFFLVDPLTDQVIQEIFDGDVIDPAVLRGDAYAVMAVWSGDGETESVMFNIDGEGPYIENVEPYAVFGDQAWNGDFFGQTIPDGAVSLTATGYDQDRAAGDALGSETISFSFGAPPAVPAEFGLGRTEAEALDLFGYDIQSHADASSSEIIATDVEGAGSAVFSGDEGEYQLDIAYRDESGGAATWRIILNGVVIDAWTGNNDTDAFEIHTVEIALAPGDVLTLSGGAQGDETAMVDYIELSHAGDPPPPPPPPPPEVAEITQGVTQAEALTLDNYEIENRSDASANALIRTFGEGGATGEFTGEDGEYTLDVSYFNESDGVASWIVLVNGVVVDTWFGVGGSGVTGSEQIRSIELDLKTGDRITIEGLSDGNQELARIDYIRLTESKIVDPPPPPPPPPPPEDAVIGIGRTEAEDLEFTGYESETRSDASDGALIRTFTDGAVSGEFTGEDGDYVIDVAYFNESDGVAIWSLLVNGAQVDTWSGIGGVSGTGSVEHRHITLNLKQGDIVTINGESGGGELARIDYLSVRAVGDEPAGNAILVGRTEVEALDLQGYEVEQRGDASNNALVRTQSDGSATGVFEGADGTYTLYVGYFNESDGVSSWKLFINDIEVDAWQGVGGTTVTGSLEERQVTVNLTDGDVIRLTSTASTGELGRIDFIEVIEPSGPDAFLIGEVALQSMSVAAAPIPVSTDLAAASSKAENSREHNMPGADWFFDEPAGIDPETDYILA